MILANLTYLRYSICKHKRCHIILFSFRARSFLFSFFFLFCFYLCHLCHFYSLHFSYFFFRSFLCIHKFIYLSIFFLIFSLLYFYTCLLFNWVSNIGCHTVKCTLTHIIFVIHLGKYFIFHWC